MSKYFCVTMTVVKDFLVEVEDHENSDNAVMFVTENTVDEWVEIESSEIDKNMPINKSLYEDCYFLDKADGKGG